jgi:hypothetical protein
VALKSEIEGLKSEIDKQTKESSVLQEVLKSKEKVGRALRELILFEFDDQLILNLASALQSEASSKDSLEEDLKKYGSLKKLIDGLNQEVRKLETQNKLKQAERGHLKIPQNETDKIREMQEYAVFAPLRAARGEPVNVNHLRRAVTFGIDMALERLGSNNQASYAFKQARDIIPIDR